MMESNQCCDYCLYNEYDEQTDEYCCSVDMDTDDLEKFSYGSFYRQKDCPFFRVNNEYKIVEKQN